MSEEFEPIVRNHSPELDAILGKPFKTYDKGFVRVVDYMGNEASIVQAARVSYGKGTKKTSEDVGLIRYLLRHRHCYDSSTEVLTSNGFVKWPEVVAEDELGIWDDEKETLCYEKPEYLTRDIYDGEMYRVDHGGIDLLVTPEHKMWVKTKVWTSDQKMEWSKKWSLIKSSVLGNKSTVRYSKIAPYKTANPYISNEFKNNDSGAFLELIGFFIGDGSSASTNSISFHLKKTRKQKYIKSLAERLGWELKEGAPNSIGATNFSIVVPNIGESFRDMFYIGKDKTVPNFLMKLNNVDSFSVLEGLKNSDGTIKRGAWVYSTSVEKVAFSMQVIALHAGEAAHIIKPCEGTNIWRISVMSRMRYPVINQNSLNTSTENYTGYVYCAKTRTGVLVVRRNGKISLSGNTTPFEMVHLKLHVKVPMDTWRQWIRHRTASVNEYSTRYSEAIDDMAVTLPGEWRYQSTTNKQGSSGFLPEHCDCRGTGNVGPTPTPYEPGITCPKCDGTGLDGATLSERERLFHETAKTIYRDRLKAGVAREQARKDLPLSNYTEAYWRCDLHNLLNGFLSLRLDKHAQKEIRDCAAPIHQIVKIWVPNVYQAFEDYDHRRSALLLTRLDTEVIAALNVSASNAIKVAQEFRWLDRREDGTLKDIRERVEFEAKAKRLGLTIPWSNHWLKKVD